MIFMRKIGNSSKARSLVKALTYRLSGSFITVLITLVFSESFKLGATIGIIDFIVKVVLYYAHERIWNLVPFGKEKI